MTITAASGATVQELMDFFLKNDICFQSNVILRDVTVAGIVSTGCHVSEIHQAVVQFLLCKMTLKFITM